MSEIAHFIDNARVAGTPGRSQPVFNPATGSTEKTVALASSVEVDRAVAAAAAAWPAWAKTPSLRRARILDRFKTILWERRTPRRSPSLIVIGCNKSAMRQSLGDDPDHDVSLVFRSAAFVRL